MRISESFISKLPLADAAKTVANGNLDRMPPMVMDRCLGDAIGDLTRQTAAAFASGHTVQSETLTMPRKRFGPRPIQLMSPLARTMYVALVEKLRADLPPESRESDNWASHSAFGMPGSEGASNYVVEFDIASCYEYVEHPTLRDQLNLHTMDLTAVDYVCELLGETFGRPRGLPQLTKSSDLLADTYLEALSRDLLRAGYTLSRYVDDFKVLAGSWSEANAVIELAAELARGLGLILSTEKTAILKASTLEARRDERERFVTRTFESAESDLTDFFSTEYGNAQTADKEPAEEEAVREALRRVLAEVASADVEAAPNRANHALYASVALSMLEGVSPRVPNRQLRDIVFRHPPRLEAVCTYLLAVPEGGNIFAALAGLAGMERQSPWAKIWLLHSGDARPSTENRNEARFTAWAERQVGDRHEVVRSEAAWYLAGRKRADRDMLSKLYARGSSLTRPAVAAAIGRQGLAASSGLGRAVRGDSTLSRLAFDWGVEH